MQRLRLLFAGLVSFLSTAHGQPAPAPLAEAFQAGADEFDRWAYTEQTTITNEHGKPAHDRIVRFDPSKPYAEQYTPIEIDGHAPTAKELADYRKRGVDRGERLAKEAAKDADRPPKAPDHHVEINGERAGLDLEHAQLLSEDGATYRYLIPLIPEGHHSLPIDKLELVIDVSKDRHRFTSAQLRLKSATRFKLIARVSKGEFTVTWSQIDPRYTPVMTSQHVMFAATVVFVHFNGEQTVRRGDFQRVKPYSERFGVKIGPMTTLPF